MTDTNCEALAIGAVATWPHDGSRCANGEVCLKFVDHVNVARATRTLCGTRIQLVSYLFCKCVIDVYTYH